MKTISREEIYPSHRQICARCKKLIGYGESAIKVTRTYNNAGILSRAISYLCEECGKAEEVNNG